MTEAEWMDCADPQRMLEFLQGKGSARKQRLFVVECCCRAVRGGKQVGYNFLATAEKWVNGQTDGEALRQTFNDSQVPFLLLLSLVENKYLEVAEWAMQEAIGFAYDAGLSQEVEELQKMMDCCLPDFNQPRCHVAAQEERLAQASSLHDLFGPTPFRSITVDSAWLTWQNGTIPKLAQGIYADHAFDRLPILADALEEAGCIDADILSHCRQPGPHGRGCWIVDLLLRKE